MANPIDQYDDQAGSLRRMMAGPQPRVFSVLSAITGQDKSRMLSNLAVSLQRHGSEALVINADTQQTLQAYGALGMSTLSAVAAGQAGIKGAIKRVKQGFAVANLMTIKQLREGLPLETQYGLNALVTDLADQYDVILVDAELNSAFVLPLDVLNEGEIVIQLNQHPDTIKNAYRLIKQIYSQLGCRNFGILMTDVTTTEAERLFRNLAEVAQRYLGVKLDFMGAIPPDEHINKASKLGRAVVEAFPMALASSAFKALAQRLNFGRDVYVAG